MFIWIHTHMYVSMNPYICIIIYMYIYEYTSEDRKKGKEYFSNLLKAFVKKPYNTENGMFHKV